MQAFGPSITGIVEAAVVSWLVCPSLDLEVLIQALAGDIVLSSWARHYILTVPPFTQVYKLVQANLVLGGNAVMDMHPFQEGGVKMLSVNSCYRTRSPSPMGS